MNLKVRRCVFPTMRRLFAFLSVASLSVAVLATPPERPPEDDVSRFPPPTDGYDWAPPRYPEAYERQGLVFPPVPRGRDGYGESDPIGDVWEMSEIASWSGVWIRRGRSPTFDGYWTNPNGERVRATLDIRSRGNRVVAIRSHPDGQSCRYQGTIAADGVQVRGDYTCSWERTPMPWQAQIIRMEDVSPHILRRNR